MASTLKRQRKDQFFGQITPVETSNAPIKTDRLTFKKFLEQIRGSDVIINIVENTDITAKQEVFLFSTVGMEMDNMVTLLGKKYGSDDNIMIYQNKEYFCLYFSGDNIGYGISNDIRNDQIYILTINDEEKRGKTYLNQNFIEFNLKSFGNLALYFPVSNALSSMISNRDKLKRKVTGISQEMQTKDQMIDELNLQIIGLKSEIKANASTIESFNEYYDNLAKLHINLIHSILEFLTNYD